MILCLAVALALALALALVLAPSVYPLNQFSTYLVATLAPSSSALIVDELDVG